VSDPAPSPSPPALSAAERDELRRHGILLTGLEELYNWGRSHSVWPLQFGLACCAIEMIAASMARFDIARFGSEVFRPSPRQADLLIISGTVTKKMAPQVVRLWNQMPEPKYCIAMGACAISGGPFKQGYNVLKGIDRYIPVDIYIPGCPPRPEALLHGLMELQKKIRGQSISGPEAPRHLQAGGAPECTVPEFGKNDLEPPLNPEVGKPPTLVRGEGAPPLVAMETLEEIRSRILTRFPEATIEVVANPGPAAQHSLLIDAVHARAIAEFLRDDPQLRLDYCSNATGVDWPAREIEESTKTTVPDPAGGPDKVVEQKKKRTVPGYLEAVYHLYSVALRHGPVVLRQRTGNRTDQVTVPSLTPVWRSCEFQEREAFDLFGIVFAGHPDLRRLLMWEEFKDHPMRKDYVPPDDFEWEPTPHGDVLAKARQHYPASAKETPAS